MTQPISTVTATSWEQLRDILENLANAGWAFRGQSDASWPVYSSLSRYLVSFGIPKNDWLNREQRIIRIFRRKTHLLLSQVPDQDQVFEWLALMQHHGAPTRLLDFTWSPYVATFFALERATGDAVIWCLCPGGKYVPNYNGISINNLLQRGFMESRTRTLLVGDPFRMNQRLTAQSGTFVIPGRLDQPLDALVPRKSAARIVLKTSSLRRAAMERLYNMNITNATLFPGVDGLAKSLGFELEYRWSIDPKAMETVVRTAKK